MAVVALIAYAVHLALAFGLRTAIQVRHTGSSGFKGVSGRPGSAEWLAVVLFVAGLGATLAAQVAMGDPWRIGVDETERTGRLSA